MDLLRLHAYEVSPQRLSQNPTSPRGGAVTLDAAFTSALDDFLADSRLLAQPLVAFRGRSSAETSQSPSARDLILAYAFGNSRSAKSSALALATRLSLAMDDRSPFTLMLLAAYRNANTRRTVIWAFPKEEPFHFATSGTHARIKILNDAFSKTSSFRKGAAFEGINSPHSFLNGHIIDRQAEHGYGTAADYWVSNFLESRPSLTGTAGTKLLAKCLRATYDALDAPEDRDQISNAIVAAHASRRPTWSLQRFANEYLSGAAKDMFIAKSPPESRASTFRLQKDEFEKKLNFRVFRLADDVMVSAPFGRIGASVKLRDGEERWLTCEGRVVDEKVRARYG
ncbi:MAG TPA: hypothetical protein VG055_03210 [Planctomycetaceae bacterium]|jgi:hypothetical protein|nr:hypothetical protein [Planctomycetaceae bacterium]